jgi:hypothetical protein
MLQFNVLIREEKEYQALRLLILVSVTAELSADMRDACCPLLHRVFSIAE